MGPNGIDNGTTDQGISIMDHNTTLTIMDHNTTLTKPYQLTTQDDDRELRNLPLQPLNNNPELSNTNTEQIGNTHNIFPKILLSNIRSFGRGDTDKTTEIDLVLKMNEVDIGVFTETWATENSIESLSFDDFSLFHLTRSNYIRPSGGISIFVKNGIPATRLKVNVPSHLEIIYVSLTPSWLPRAISNIIICGLYYPGSNSIFAPNQVDLTSHIIETFQSFNIRYSRPLFIILGDFNDLDFTDLCETCNLKQVVNVPTRGNRTLDLILTNINNGFYADPITLPSIGNSDHLSVLYTPKAYIKQKDVKRKLMIRIFKKSGMIEFGSWIANFNWVLLYRIQDVNDKIAYFCKNNLAND